jgi:serine/threonine protein kinase
VTLATGTRLGPYEIVAPIGSGGMGDVYKARDAVLQRVLALKVLTARIEADPNAIARFHREARAIAALNHPHIVTIYAADEVDGHPRSSPRRRAGEDDTRAFVGVASGVVRPAGAAAVEGFRRLARR